MATVHDFEVTTIDGDRVKLDRYAGRVLLVVNVASACGLTPQYEGLEALHRKYGSAGLEVLGFPCNQFGHQEPGTEADIKAFCTSKFDVTFPMFAKVDVNGPKADPLFVHLRSAQPGPNGPCDDAIGWNFAKFLVDRDGRVVHRFEPTETPSAIEGVIAQVLSTGR